MEEKLNEEARHEEEQEIDLMELAGQLWDKRRTILKWCLVGAVVGLIVAFSIPREYSTSVKLAPEIAGNKTGGGGLSSLASLAGINLNAGATADAVYPQLYPDVLSSAPFMVDILGVSLPTKDGEVYTVNEILETTLHLLGGEQCLDFLSRLSVQSAHSSPIRKKPLRTASTLSSLPRNRI